jgi:hypothetical protein
MKPLEGKTLGGGDDPWCSGLSALLCWAFAPVLPFFSGRKRFLRWPAALEEGASKGA